MKETTLFWTGANYDKRWAPVYTQGEIVKITALEHITAALLGDIQYQTKPNEVWKLSLGWHVLPNVIHNELYNQEQNVRYQQ